MRKRGKIVEQTIVCLLTEIGHTRASAPLALQDGSHPPRAVGANCIDASVAASSNMQPSVFWLL